MDDATTRLALELLVEIEGGMNRIEAQLDGFSRSLARVEGTVATIAVLPRFIPPAVGEGLR